MHSFLVAIALGIFSTSIDAANLDPSSRAKRMIGGHTTFIQEFPYLVALFKQTIFICGGAIVSPYYVITAAHCVNDVNADPSWFVVRAGSSYRNQGGSLHRVRVFAVHPDHTGNTVPSHYDLAVVQLLDPIYMDFFTKRPIGMFQFGEVSPQEALATVPGWGRDGTKMFPYQLRSMNLRIVGKGQCNEMYIRRQASLYPGEICASYEFSPEESICYGDSGGPLVIGGRLAGVVSHMVDCETMVPNVFTEIAYFRGWIDEMIEELSNLR